jgi:leucyl/phenylalanyl-tRNA--protein transferase
VIRECQKKNRPGQSGTWITESLLHAYVDFHRAGYAHSFEAWEGEKLVGGMYGVYVAGLFCGESMFFKQSDASKLCLHRAVEFLKDHGKTWMDVQMVTPYLESVGARYITRKEFLKRLEEEKKHALAIF